LQDKAEQTVEEAIGLWRELGNQPMLADSLATATLLTSRVGDYEKTIALSDESYQISLSIKNTWGQSYSRMAIGQLYWLRGEPDKAIEAMTECVRLGEQAGFLPAQLYVGSYLALSYASLGDFERGLAMARRALAETRANMPYYEPVLLSNLGQVLLLAGDLQEATAVFEELMAVRNFMEPLLEAAVEEGKCRFLLSQNGYDRAAQSAGKLVEILQEMDGRALLPTAQHLRGMALMGAGQLDQAQDALTLALSEAQDMMLLWSRWQILASLAKLQIASGQTDQAEQSRVQARQDFETIASRVPTAELRESFENHPHWAVYSLNSADVSGEVVDETGRDADRPAGGQVDANPEGMGPGQ
jgi:tetratricopeptide (TPR) repeat protein